MKKIVLLNALAFLSLTTAIASDSPKKSYLQELAPPALYCGALTVIGAVPVTAATYLLGQRTGDSFFGIEQTPNSAFALTLLSTAGGCYCAKAFLEKPHEKTFSGKAKEYLKRAGVLSLLAGAAYCGSKLTNDRISPYTLAASFFTGQGILNAYVTSPR